MAPKTQADISTIKSLCRAKLDTEVLLQVKNNWPEKLATVWDAEKKDWAVDDVLLKEIKASV